MNKAKSSSDHGHTQNSSVKNLKTVFFLNLIFTCIEVAGGILTGSLAIISDALHDLGDSVALGLSWAFEKYAFKKRTRRYTYGYKRFSLLGGLITAIILIVGSVFVISEAVKRIFQPTAVYVPGMMVLAVLGVAVNTIAVLKMKHGKKISERIVMIHLLEDVLGWAAVLVVSVIMQFSDLPVLDPLLSLCIAVFVLSKIYPQLKATLNIFLQHAPVDFKESLVVSPIMKMKGVRHVHDLHVWTMDGEYHVATLHVVVAKKMSAVQAAAVKQKVRLLFSSHGVDHVTVEIEREGEECVSCDT
jgi:cobalt-zinc-cadmium efflux system protein